MDAPRKKRFEILRDGTGKLSDDILCYILSLLSLREAARTSILSCRWRYLWRSHIKLSRSLSLDFLAMKGCSTSRSLSLYRGHNYWKRSILQIQSNRFIKWADEILQLGHNCGIDSFRLRFYMNRNQSHLVDSWINAAIHSKVQNIDIDLSHFAVGVDSPSQAMLYTFPCGRLFTQKTGSLVKRLHLSSCVLECVNCYLFSSLVELRLKKVPINWENMARLLSNCPNLENLSLVQCPMLDRVEISGQCKKLKYLTLYGVNMLKIDSAELTRLELRGTPKILSLENTPRLSDVRMHVMSQNVPESYLEILSKGATKLDSLLLVVHNSKGMKIPSRLSSFMNLKKLLLKVAGIKETLWGFTSLIQSCPHLEKLEIHMFNTAEECGSGKKLFDFLQLHLKEVVFTCFRGTRHEMEFIESLVSHSPALEKVSIGYEVRHYDNKGGFYVLDILAKYYHMWSDSKKRESEILAARSAWEKKYMEEQQAPVLFAKILPAGVKLYFL